MLLVFLIGKVLVIEDELTADSGSAQDTVASSDDATLPADYVADNSLTSIDEESLRMIIREELDAYADTIAATARQTEGNVQLPARDPHADAVQLEHVSEQIEYFMSVGRMSDSEMANLEREIARLDTEGRRAMLRKLTKAMNTGAIDARF